MQIDLTAKVRQLVFLAPSEKEAGVVRGWLAARIAPELKRLRVAQRAFAKCSPFWIG